MESAALDPRQRLELPSSSTRDARPTGWSARALLSRATGPELFVAARSLRRLASRDELRLPLPLRFTVRAWRRGFTAQNAAIYNLDAVDAGEYLTDYAQLYRCGRINPVPELFDQKLLLRRLLADRGFAQPETIALVTKHGVIEDPVGPAARHTTRPALETRLLDEGGRYIVKPHNGRYGKGIARLETRDGRLVAHRGASVRPYSVARDAPADTLIERAVEQHEFWERLSPTSVNTLRVLTLWTPGDAEPFVARAVQRIGTTSGQPTDNWDTGGVMAQVELTTGRLGAGRINRFRSTREDRPYTHHPESGAPIEGVVLPFWREILDAALAAARALPMAYYIGWDIAVDRSGRPVFIEGNKNTGVRAMQAGRGLLADAAVRRFYEVCGVV